MDILVTGGTVFASRFTAEYFARQGHSVFVLNRNTRPQSEGVTLIPGDRHDLGDTLKGYHFDAVIDVTAYNEADVAALVQGLGSFGDYILISSSAVYPETLPQPFREEQSCGPNRYWGGYGTGKRAAEEWLLDHVPQAYILRPPYLYGPMDNLYREAFVFACAERDRPFYLPGDGSMPLQFFHIEDLCRFIEVLLDTQPRQHVFNVGNPRPVTVREWVTLCYGVFGKEPRFCSVNGEVAQRDYFPFHDYRYELDVSKMAALLPETKPLASGLEEAYNWYRHNRELVREKPLMEYIDRHLR